MRFDYLIVGAGASGCALARQLSEDPTASVLLIDSGGARTSLWTGIPRAFPRALRSPRLRNYPTASRETEYWVRGQGVGGSTLINGMMYLRGNRSAYDELEARGNDGWGWAAFERAFIELEQVLRPSRNTLDPLARSIADSIAACGAHIVGDLNSTVGARVGATPATIHRGVRNDAARALLRPVRARQNLRVLPGTEVRSLTWQGTRVTGVLATRGAAAQQIHAATVVLCCGTIETPLLLERSGVGRSDILSGAGVDLRVESPHVGEGVREQRGHGLQVRLRAAKLSRRERQYGLPYWAKEAAKYATTRTGALARPAFDVTGLLPIDGADSNEVQVMGVPFGLHPSGELRPAPYPGVFLCAYPTRPTSDWSIHLATNDPTRTATITPPTMLTDDDCHAAQAATDALARIAENGRLGELAEGLDDDAPVGAGESIYHAVGSAAMGADRGAVTDSNLTVRGTQGLRVADLSVLPFHTSGSTAAPAMAIGWLAARRIRDTPDS